MPTYRIAQDSGSIRDAGDCWSVYKKLNEDDVDTEDLKDEVEEVIAIVQTEALAKSILLIVDQPEATEKIGGKYYTWHIDGVSSGYFKTIDEAIQDFKDYDSRHMTLLCPDFEHVEVTSMDGGFVDTTVSTLTWEERARILDAAIKQRGE